MPHNHEGEGPLENEDSAAEPRQNDERNTESARQLPLEIKKENASGELRFKNVVYTYRIFKENHGYYKIQTVEGARKQIFPNLKELISKFEKPNQGLVVHLLTPIRRASPSLRRRRLKMKLDENSNSDYVDVLP